jgi:hypothetical protein
MGDELHYKELNDQNWDASEGFFAVILRLRGRVKKENSIPNVALAQK